MPVEIIVRPTLGSYTARAKGLKGTASRSEGPRQAAEALIRKLDLGAGQLLEQASKGGCSFPTKNNKSHTELKLHKQLNVIALEEGPCTKKCPFAAYSQALTWLCRPIVLLRLEIFLRCVGCFHWLLVDCFFQSSGL